ncbi:lamin tail domain-containing protein [Sorangium sp. So ce1097]|uniref:lamin tail domain-containing protein n=1 Tax=Sorangium sp. So ce1097 TaxID=3133330 RepID=UPI003F60DB3A
MQSTFILGRCSWARLPLLLSALALAACAADPLDVVDVGPEAALLGEHSEALSTRVRLMAANLTSGTKQSYDPGHGMRIMQGVEPDIVLLQEFNYGDNSISDIREFVDDTFGAGFSYYREAGAQIPNGIVSRWPIVESGEWNDSSVSNRDFAWARIDIPGPVDLWAVSVHFLTSGSGVRNTEAEQLVSYIESVVPDGDYLVVGGDFNTGSRAEACITTLKDVVVAQPPYPADANGNTNTNAGRTKPYDWVLVDGDLEQHEVAVALGGSSFANGLVVDTRVYSPLADISPASSSDSGAPNMQHMGVVRDFLIPDGGSGGSGGGGGGNGGGGGGGGGGNGSSGGGGGGGNGTGTAIVIINEVLANEAGSNVSGEFVEIINVGGGTASLGGWTLADGTATRHTFPAGASLAPSTAIVVYGNASAVPSGSGAVGASTGTLHLGNGGDTVTLRNASGATVDSVAYSSTLAGQDGVSMNRSPDASAGAPFVLHSELGGSSSPGKRASGLRF